MLLATAGTLFINTFTLEVVKAFGGGATAWTLTFAVFGALSIAVFAFSFLFTHERVIEVENTEVKTNVVQEMKALLKNKYWLMMSALIFLLYLSLTVNGGSGVYFAKAVLGDDSLVAPIGNATTIAQIATMFVAPLAVKRLGKRYSFLIGIGITVVASAIMAVVGANYSMILAANVIKGIGNGFAAACLWGMLSDTIEYGEWKTGIRSAGLANAASSFGSKVASGIGGAVLGMIMAAGGYDGAAAVQSASAIAAVNTVYIYVPLVLGVASVAILLFYKLDDEYDTIIKDLEARKLAK